MKKSMDPRASEINAKLKEYGLRGRIYSYTYNERPRIYKLIILNSLEEFQNPNYAAQTLAALASRYLDNTASEVKVYKKRNSNKTGVYLTWKSDTEVSKKRFPFFKRIFKRR